MGRWSRWRRDNVGGRDRRDLTVVFTLCVSDVCVAGLQYFAVSCFVLFEYMYQGILSGKLLDES